MGYTVRVAAAVEAQEWLVGLWRHNLQMRGRPEDKYLWFYRGNPLGDAVAFLLESSSDGRDTIVGCCGLGERIVVVDGQARRAGLLADFAVSKDHRTVLPALMLQRALSEYSRQRFDLTYAFPNESAVGVLSRVGLPLLGRMGRYVCVLRSAQYLARYVKPAALATAGGVTLDGALSIREAARRISFPRHLELDWLTDVDERFDQLWELARRRYACIGERNRRFLQWRFTKRPALPATVAALIDRRSREVRAYAAIVEKEPGTALVADFLAATDDELRVLLRLLRPGLRRRRFMSAVTFFLGAPAVGATIAAAGFAFRQPAKFVVVGAGESGVVDPTILTDSQRWYITEADRDN